MYVKHVVSPPFETVFLTLLKHVTCTQISFTDKFLGIHVEVFWVVKPQSVVVGYQHFKTHATLICRVKMEAAWASKMLVFYYNTLWHHNPEDLNLNSHHCGNLESCMKLQGVSHTKYPFVVSTHTGILYSSKICVSG
jgi:hypothetical protein